MQRFIKQPDKKELRNFGFVTGGLILTVFGLVLPWFFGHDYSLWPWVTGALLLVFASTLPTTLKPVYLVWMTIGNILGWINTRIILSIMFYLIILPVGLIKRLAGTDSMTRAMSKEQQSYRVIIAVAPKNHVERPY